jgi:hypothetical protein
MRERGAVSWGAIASLCLLSACGDASKGAAPSAEPVRDAPVASASASASVSASAPMPSAVAPTAAPSAEPAKNIVRSGRPTPLDWCKAPIAQIGKDAGADGGSPCSMIEVREWVMLWCPASGNRQNGESLGHYDRALPSGGSMANDDEIAAATRSAPGGRPRDAVIVSLRPGTKAQPTFTYRPEDHPDWLRDEGFEVSLPESARGLEDRRFGGGAWPVFTPRDASACEALEAATKAEADAKRAAADEARAAEDAKVLDDLADLPAPPEAAAFEAEKDVLVKGSTAMGCATRLIGSWFWMRCTGKVEIRGIEIERGRRTTQTSAKLEDGVATLLVPYVEGTDLRVKLVHAAGERFFFLRWPKGPRPFEVGTFGATR